MMPITALVAALLAPVYSFLALRVITQRGVVKVGIGDGGDKLLMRRMRVHANFAENVPYALILMGLAENLQAAPRLLYVIGGCLIVGRLSHAWGVSQARETFAFRTAGMVLTFAAIGIAAVACIFHSVWRV